MSSSLYEEAIADAMAIREAAESRAKQSLVESMTPKIKELVEKKLMEELSEKEACEADVAEEEVKEISEEEQQECGQYEGEVKEISLDEDKLEEDPDLVPGIEEYGLNEESFNVLKKLMTKNKLKSVVAKKINKLSENIKHLKTALTLSENRDISSSQKRRINSIYKKLVAEAKNIDFDDIIKSDRNLYETFIQLNKELKTMSTRRRKSEGFLNESLEDLLETSLFLEDDDKEVVDLMPDEEADSNKEEIEDAGDEVAMPDLERAQDALVDLADALGLNDPVDGEDDADDSEAEETQEEEAKESEEAQDEEAETEGTQGEEADGDEELDLSNLEADLTEEGIEEIADAHIVEGDVVLEIDEEMLRNEILRMKQIRENNDVDDSEINVHTPASDAPHASLTNEAALENVEKKNRLLESKLEEYAKALKGMKAQLSEMNLFNAKLLYANKLMQNRDLSIKQQRHIVESLDEAGTLNEAKLLFESLSKSLTKPGRGESLTEGANRKVLGSASKAARSAQPNKAQNVEVNRWAKLAGLKK